MDDQLRHYTDKLAYEIDSWDLSVALKNEEDVVVVDARSAQAYAIEHIPGAINLPHKLMDAESVSIIRDSAIIVVYCDGIGCNASTKGALAMVKLGFTVKELMGGLDWWKRDGHATRKGGVDVAENASCGCE